MLHHSNGNTTPHFYNGGWDGETFRIYVCVLLVLVSSMVYDQLVESTATFSQTMQLRIIDKGGYSQTIFMLWFNWMSSSNYTTLCFWWKGSTIQNIRALVWMRHNRVVFTHDPDWFHVSCLLFTNFHTILVACNGFPLDFISIMIEVKHHKLDEIFYNIIQYLLTHGTMLRG